MPRRLAGFAVRRPIAALVLGLGLCTLAALGALRVHIDTHVTSLLPHGHPALDRFATIQEHLGAADLLALVVTPPSGSDADRDATRAVIEHCAEAALAWRRDDLPTPEPLIDGVQGRPDPALDQIRLDLLVANTWLFLDEDEQDRLVHLLDPRRWPSNLANPSAAIPPQLQDRDPLGIWTRIYADWWQERLDANLPLDRDGDYLIGPDHSHVLLCQAHGPAHDSVFTHQLMQRLDSLLQEVAERWPEQDLQILGPYILVERDYATVRESAVLTLVSSLLGVLLLFAVSYRSLRLPLLIAVSLLPAAGAALGLAAFLLGGSLTMIVTAFAAILIGLGVDFVIHLYNGYLWSLGRLRLTDPSDPLKRKRRRALAVLQAVDRVGGGIIAAGLTSIGTFLILMAGHYRGLSELGAVCGLGLGVIMIQLLVVVPAFLVLAGPDKGHTSRLLAPLAHGLLRWPRAWSVALALLFTVAIVFLANQPELIAYDRNPRNLRPANDTVFEFQIQTARRFGLMRSGHQILLVGDDAEGVLQAGQAFLDRAEGLTTATTLQLQEPIDTARLLAGEVADGRVTGLPDVLHGRRTLRTQLGEIWFEAVDGDRLLGLRRGQGRHLEAGRLEAGDELTLLPLIASANHPLRWFDSPSTQRQHMARLDAAIDWQGIDQQLAAIDPAIRAERAPFLQDFAAMRTRIAARDPLLPDDLAGSPLEPLVRSAWHATDGRTLLRLPMDINHRTGQTGFADMLTALGLDPQGQWTEIDGSGVRIGTAGPPSIAFVLEDILKQDFTQLSLLAVLVTVLLLALTMRSPQRMLLALGSLTGGLLLALAVFHLVGQRWNLMNIAVLPLVIGIGVDNAIHFLHAAHHARPGAAGIDRVIIETGHPIVITALTSIIGFGSLMLNAYQGVQSLGLTAVIGIGACLFVSLTLLPLLCLLYSRVRRQAV